MINRVSAIIVFTLFVIVITLVIKQRKENGLCGESYQEHLKSEYSNIISRKYRVPRNHNARIIELVNGKKINLSGFGKTKLFENAKKGDILIKQKNRLKYTLIRKTDTIDFEIRVSDCDKFIED